MKTTIIVSALCNYSSFPDRPLASLNNKTLLELTLKVCKDAFPDKDLYVVTDKKRLSDLFSGENCLLVESNLGELQSVAKAISSNKIRVDCFIVVQSHNPLIIDSDLKAIKKSYDDDDGMSIWIGMKKLSSDSEYADLKVPKVVFDCSNYLLYCSRAGIPRSYNNVFKGGWRLVPIYAISRSNLDLFLMEDNVFGLSDIEDIEILNALERGSAVYVEEVHQSYVDISSPYQLSDVGKKLRELNRI